MLNARVDVTENGHVRLTDSKICAENVGNVRLETNITTVAIHGFQVCGRFEKHKQYH